MNIKEATQAVISFLKDLPTEEQIRPPITVEEIDQGYDERLEKELWYITIGYYTTMLSTLSRKLKTFAIDKKTGEIISMKIKSLK